MATSGSTDFGLVTNTIIEKAYNRLGVGSEGEALTARMYEDGRSSLNLMVKAWGASGHLWLKTEASVTLVASQGSYDLTTLFTKKPLRVLSVRRRLTSSTQDTPLWELSREEYDELPNKTSEGVPVQFYYDPQRSTGTLYVWPEPSTAVAAANTLRVSYLRPIEDFDASNDDPDLPQEWLNALIWNLADELEPEYPCNNPRLAGKIADKAAESKALIEAWDTEPASLYLQPDWRC